MYWVHIATFSAVESRMVLFMDGLLDLKVHRYVNFVMIRTVITISRGRYLIVVTWLLVNVNLLVSRLLDIELIRAFIDYCWLMQDSLFVVLCFRLRSLFVNVHRQEVKFGHLFRSNKLMMLWLVLLLNYYFRLQAVCIIVMDELFLVIRGLILGFIGV